MAKKLPIQRASAFTLVEVLVSIAVLALLVALIAQLFNNTTTASTVSTTHLEADARVRLLFGRMAADFSHIVKRTDVDYYLKSPTYVQTGNDQMALFSEVSGYSSVTDAQNSVSLIAYRINNTGSAPCLERLGKALSWGGGSSSILPLPFLPRTVAVNWPAVTLSPATSATSDPAYDQDYETIVPNAFRFEYYYLLHSGVLSATPWDTAAGHSTINGLQDVAGIGVVIAVADRKASALATSTQLQALSGQMADWATTTPSGISTPPPGTLTTIGTWQTVWQQEVSLSTLSPAIKNGIRIYEQVFCIDTPSQ